MEKIRIGTSALLPLVSFLVLSLCLGACSQKFLSHEKSKELSQNAEFEQIVKIVEETPPDSTTLTPSLAPELQASTAPEQKTGKVKGSVKERKEKKSKAKKKQTPKNETVDKNNSGKDVVTPRLPEIESSEGFEGRRPLIDPFRVGEKVTHSVNYFSMKAGTLTLETRPFAMVNGIKNYQFRTSIKTASFFDSFYSVDDYVDVLMDYNQLTPGAFALHVKESAQLKEAQMFFDFAKLKATYWEKKITEKDGEENKKLEWEIAPYAQNVFSAAFYMRIFRWEVGKENAFSVADNEKNLIFRAKAIRKEKLQTAVGEFDAIVIRPEIELKGKYNPVGDNYIWLSDDDRKLILRIESKIKIGTLVSEVIDIQKGQ